MQTISIITIILAVYTLGTMIFAYYKWIEAKKEKAPPLMEPDLDLLEHPDLISKVPENETKIPDANGPEGEPLKQSAS
jgi:hypothetical protein